MKEERSYKVKFSGGGLEAVESEGEGDGGILHLRPVLGQTQLHGQSSLGSSWGERGKRGHGIKSILPLQFQKCCSSETEEKVCFFMFFVRHLFQ